MRELEELLELVEEYLKDLLPYLMEWMPLAHEYETMPLEPRLDGPLPIYTLTADRIRYLPEEEVARKEREAGRGARFR